MPEAGAPGAPGRPGRVRVVIVDDHQMFRSGVRAELGDGVEVVGEAGDVGAAVAVIAGTHPDVVLLDVHLPGGGGTELLRQMPADGPRFLALSVSDAAEDVIGVVRGGARGYVTKAISGQELTDAIVRVLSNSRELSKWANARRLV
jgi:DNA-binding NarL/FixJ family response regulator